MEYDKKLASQPKKYIFEIWNNPGIFHKHCITTKIFEFLEYGIFLEYSKKSITCFGGVKFNQVRNTLFFWSDPLRNKANTFDN